MAGIQTVPVPVCATVSRKTGEIRFEYARDGETTVRFGRIMNRIGREAERYEDRKVKADAEARRTAAAEA